MIYFLSYSRTLIISDMRHSDSFIPDIIITIMIFHSIVSLLVKGNRSFILLTLQFAEIRIIFSGTIPMTDIPIIIFATSVVKNAGMSKSSHGIIAKIS